MKFNKFSLKVKDPLENPRTLFLGNTEETFKIYKIWNFLFIYLKYLEQNVSGRNNAQIH